jgi:hypothetical protein
MAAGLSRCGRGGPTLLVFGFELNALVFTYVVNHTHIEFLFAVSSNCAVLMRKSASVRTSNIKQKLNTEHATYDSNI